MPYVWNADERRYRDTSTGRWVSAARVREAAQQIVENGVSQSEALAELVISGQLSPEDWEAQFRETLKRRSLSNYMLGRGGRNTMAAADYGRVGAYLRGEYKLLRLFRADIEAGNVTPSQIRARSRQYFNSARILFEKGKAAAYDLVNKLPSYPGDGHQTCQQGCRCYWEFKLIKDEQGRHIETHATWKLTPGAEHCEPDSDDGTRGCIQNAAEYNPLVFKVD